MAAQHDTKIVVAYIRGEVITYGTLNPFVGFVVDDVSFQNFDGGKSLAITRDINIHMNNIQLDAIAVFIRIIPMRQSIEAVVNHVEGFAQVCLALFATGQVGKVGG